MPSLRRTTICREGWCYLIVLALVFGGALVRDVNLLIVLSGLMAGPLLLSRFMAVFTLRGLQVRRKLPPGICAGELLVSGVTLSNTRRRVGSWAVVVEDQLQRAANGQGKPRRKNGLHPSVFFPYLPAGQQRQGAYRGRLPQRGRYQLGPLRLSTRFPFGMFCHTVTVGKTEPLLVLPRLGRLTRDWMARHHESFAGTNRREQRAGADGDFYGIRPWRSGDSRRWIHWRTSARTGKLMVRQFEQPRNRDVALLVDLWQPPAPQPIERENVELAVSFAATVVADLCHKGQSGVYLAAASADGVPLCGGGPASPALMQELLEQLALIEGQSEDHLVALLEAVLNRTEPGTELVLVATRPVDLSDAARLGRLLSDPARRAALRRVRVVDTSSPELARYFHME